MSSGRAHIAANLLTVSEERMAMVHFKQYIEHEDVVLVCNVDLLSLPYLKVESILCTELQFVALDTYNYPFTGGIILWTEKMVYFHSDLASGYKMITYAIGFFLQRNVGGILPKNISCPFVFVTFTTVNIFNL